MVTGNDSLKEGEAPVPAGQVYDQLGLEAVTWINKADGLPTSTPHEEAWPNPWPQPIPGRTPLYPLNVERWQDTTDTEEKENQPVPDAEQPTPGTGDDSSTVPEPIRLAQRAIDLVYTDREADYGHPADDYGRTAAMWSGFLGVNITPYQAAIMMVLVKLSREFNKHKDDNIVDAHGYLLVAGRIRERNS